ncbi:uncharacterized protein CCOS01_04500 [Colletotrichum costaricense]|uniref:Uncharacterized protein n=2 Tax=Colletotrichum acutatum species complex TaxID=2707335 RepID=A0AAJ0E2Z9_9PEZI|nr:uncharacterized protein CCOS01_04500 [Colletotrichum costaricense]XP_060378824.1 uncharacterized protein CTAM01_10561 [Colletotrichum tamarilloi]KAK1490851.1 hypothetical protein CTAM01_10561 [Colletotrichum tamarilloi]KAK1532517.1 hypothetical protein CCOS01_04500 [Colletotrichum costaricense]
MWFVCLAGAGLRCDSWKFWHSASNTVSQHLSSDPRSSDAIRTEQHLDNGPLRPRYSITWTRRQMAARIMPVPPPLPLSAPRCQLLPSPSLG